MKCRYSFFALLILIGSFLPVSIFSANQNGRGEPDKKTIIIRLKDQFDVASCRSRIQGVSPEIKKQIVVGDMKEFCRQSQSRFIGSLAKVKLIDKMEKIEKFWLTNVIVCEATDSTIELLKKRSEVESVHVDTPRKTFEEEAVWPAPLNNANSIAENISLVRAIEANEYGYSGKGIVVAVLDSGVDYEHEDLKDHLWMDENYPNHGWDFCNDDDDPMDDNGHGTHCAGTVLGNGKAGVRTGVAPDARLMILKTMSSEGKGKESDCWKAIQFAVDHGANVVSMSVGWMKQNNPDEKGWRDLLVNLLNCNVLCVVAAGNEGGYIKDLPAPDNVRVPGSCPAAWLHPEQPDPSGISSAVTVGATDRTGEFVPDFSCKGPSTWQNIAPYNDYPYNPGAGLIKPDIVAPGNQIISLKAQTTNQYIRLTGTSMATPCVAGIVACMLSKNPTLTPTDIVRILSESSIPLVREFNSDSGAGRADALYATLYTPNTDVNCVSYTLEKTKGYDNGLFNAGDEAFIDLVFDSNLPEALSNCELELKLFSPSVTITRNSEDPVTISSGQTTVKKRFTIKVSEDAVPAADLRFSVELREGDKLRTNLFKTFIAKTQLSSDAFQLKEITGNGNKIADKGEELELSFPIINVGNEICKAVKATLSTDSPYLTLNTSELIPVDIETSHTFVGNVNISKDTPDWHIASLALQLKGENIDTTFNYTLNIGKVGALIINRSVDGKSAQAFQSYLDARKDVSYLFMDEFPQSFENCQSVWCFTGIFPKDRKITVTEKDALKSYMENGGYVYLEGGDIWFDEKARPRELFHINLVADSGGKLDSIVGCWENHNEGDAVKYTSSQYSIDNIAPIAPAFALYKNNVPEYITSVAYNEGNERTIGSSFELGGVIKEGTSVIADRYLEFFGLISLTGIGQVAEDSYSVVCYAQEDACMLTLSAPTTSKAVISMYTVEGRQVLNAEQLVTGFSTITMPAQGRKGLHFITVSFPEVNKVITRKVML